MQELKDRMSPDMKRSLQDRLMEIVVLPPASLIYPVHTLLMDVDGVCVGIQDVSPYPEGKHTGLISARSVESIARYALVGHAETRRRGDNVETVAAKYRQVQETDLTPLLCISHEQEHIEGARAVAYEPWEAIGTGANVAPHEVSLFRSTLPSYVTTYIYGGSVQPENCAQYLEPRICDGFLVGQASLNIGAFYALAHACAEHLNTHRPSA